MKNPTHPGFLLKDDLAALGYTLPEAAKALGVSCERLREIITGRSAITPTIAIRLEQGIGTAAERWQRMQSAYDLAQARLRAIGVRVKKLASKTRD